MGIFSRFTDIISSNINSMLDKAENPEKMIRLMIREIEETLVELKASCAGHMADRKRVMREVDEIRDKVDLWENRAKLAVEKGREDLAREALQEKRRHSRRLDGLDEERMRFDALVDQCHEDIDKLESKLEAAVEKQRFLVQRHIRADTKLRAEKNMRKANGSEAVMRFDRFEHRIERMEAEAGLVNGRSRPSLEEQFAALENDDDVEQELDKLKGVKKDEPKETEKKAKTEAKDSGGKK